MHMLYAVLAVLKKHVRDGAATGKDPLNTPHRKRLWATVAGRATYVWVRARTWRWRAIDAALRRPPSC